MTEQTKRVTLDRVFVFNGAFYGPGETDIPAAMAESLRQRGHLEEKASKRAAAKNDGEKG